MYDDKFILKQHALDTPIITDWKLSLELQSDSICQCGENTIQSTDWEKLCGPEHNEEVCSWRVCCIIDDKCNTIKEQTWWYSNCSQPILRTSLQKYLVNSTTQNSNHKHTFVLCDNHDISIKLVSKGISQIILRREWSSQDIQFRKISDFWWNQHYDAIHRHDFWHCHTQYHTKAVHMSHHPSSNHYPLVAICSHLFTRVVTNSESCTLTVHCVMADTQAIFTADMFTRQTA